MSGTFGGTNDDPCWAPRRFDDSCVIERVLDGEFPVRRLADNRAQVSRVSVLGPDHTPGDPPPDDRERIVGTIESYRDATPCIEACLWLVDQAGNALCHYTSTVRHRASASVSWTRPSSACARATYIDDQLSRWEVVNSLPEPDTGRLAIDDAWAAYSRDYVSPLSLSCRLMCRVVRASCRGGRFVRPSLYKVRPTK